MKRLAIILIVFLLIAFGVFLARSSIHQTLADWTGEEDTEWQIKGLYYLAQSYLQPPYDTADFAPMKYTDVNPFAINTFFDQEVEEAKVRRSLELIRAAGFRWIRQEFPWEDIEKPSKGTYWETKYNYSTWVKYDLIVHLAQEYGIGIIARLDHPPAWSRKDGRARGDFAPPDNYDDYGDFVEAVVKRYRDKIRFYQIWNEPNCCGEWGNQDVNPADYVRLLKLGYTRAKATDPNVVIISAGLAQTVEEGGAALNDRLFLQQMYDAGAKGYFDILAVQDYGLFSGPGDRRLDENDRINFSRPIQLREIMVKNGDANTPIWATEMGWNAQPAEFKDTPYGRVDEQRQARYTPQGYYRAQTEWPWMGALSYWFFRRVDDREKNQSMYYFRMFEPDFTPLPVYESIKNYTPTARLVDIGFKATTHWAMDWSGDWQTVRDGSTYFGEYKECGSVGARECGGTSVSFAWRGTDLDLVVKQNPYGGAVRVQIDNNPPRDIELWRTDAGAGGRVSLARDLDSGEHHAMITVMRAPVAINGFIVQNGNGWLVRRVALVVGFSLAGCLVVGFFAMWRRKR
ncbi:MAG: cellulase family glycosylhydrolase [Chloroflexi bacterium]|nr:cellulase family glycosylhydrolase [Chloroflexota bacterium]